MRWKPFCPEVARPLCPFDPRIPKSKKSQKERRNNERYKTVVYGSHSYAQEYLCTNRRWRHCADFQKVCRCGCGCVANGRFHRVHAQAISETGWLAPAHESVLPCQMVRTRPETY